MATAPGRAWHFQGGFLPGCSLPRARTRAPAASINTDPGLWLGEGAPLSFLRAGLQPWHRFQQLPSCWWLFPWRCIN